jgi:hypothetical protein
MDDADRQFYLDNRFLIVVKKSNFSESVLDQMPDALKVIGVKAVVFAVAEDVNQVKILRVT